MKFYDDDYRIINKYATNSSYNKIVKRTDYFLLVTKKDSLIVYCNGFGPKRNKAILRMWPGEIEVKK